MRRFFVVLAVAVLVGSFGATASDIPPTPYWPPTPSWSPPPSWSASNDVQRLRNGGSAPTVAPPPRVATSSGTTSASSKNDPAEDLKDAWNRFQKAAANCQDQLAKYKQTNIPYPDWDDYWYAVDEAQTIAEEIDAILAANPGLQLPQ